MTNEREPAIITPEGERITKNDGAKWYKALGLVGIVSYVKPEEREKLKLLARANGMTLQDYLAKLLSAEANAYDVKIIVKKKDKTETHELKR